MSTQSKKISELLEKHFTQRQNKNSGYSLRAFARHLGVSPSALSEILNGKRNVTLKAAEKFVNKLCLDPQERERILGAFKSKDSHNAPKHAGFVQLEADQFKIVADWYYFAILSLAETKDFESSPAAIAKRLNLSIHQAQGALERLQRLELLARDENGALVPTGKQFGSTDGIVSLGIARNHQQGLQLAMDSLQNDALDERDFSSLTMAVDPKKMPRARKMIRKFTDRMAQFLEASDKTDVYRIQVQLFPLSKGGPK